MATTFVFKTLETEAAAARRYYDERRRVLFQDILRSEQEDGRRILYEGPSAVVFLPYFARYADDVALNLLRLEAVPMGTKPSGLSYRFSIRYETEAQRQTWVASDVHTDVWGALERLLASHDYTFLLFDVY